MDNATRDVLLDAREALYNLAGIRFPVSSMNNYPCHPLGTSPEKCGRCSRQIHAWDAIDKIDALLKSGNTGS